ncbi:MAG: FtsQ-type POTRA domain-containing protein [Chloroflexi bacterium]|nr:FtsQ-type POTRA domain-containing protein [Chloroflexota bacterium]
MYKYKPGKRRRALKGYVLPDEKAERRRRRLRWRRTFIVLALLAAVAGAVVLYRSPLLRVQEVQVVNATSTSPERIAELADLEGASMFNTPLDEAEARIVALPLVKGVHAQRRWPNKVRIEVIERTPWGYWNLAGTSYVIDSEGVILPNVKPPKGAPVIHDVGDPANLSPGDRVDADAVRLAQALLKFVPDQLALRITKFEYTPEKGLSVVTDANYRVVIGDSQNVDYKLAVWKTVEEDIGRGAMAGHVLDLRFRDRPSFQ